MKKFVKLLIGIFGALILGVTAAYACSCSGHKNAEKHIASVDIIFKGVVESTQIKNKRSDHPSITYANLSTTTFTVVKFWKGQDQKIIEINHALDGGMCGVEFQRNTTVLIFAQIDEDGNFFTHDCMMPHAVTYEVNQKLESKNITTDEYYLTVLGKVFPNK